MSLIDYKFVYFRRGIEETELRVRIYSGVMITENRVGLDGQIKSVTEYKRTMKLLDKTFTVEKNRNIEEVRAFFNKKIGIWAEKMGYAVVPSQADTGSDPEIKFVGSQTI